MATPAPADSAASLFNEAAALHGQNRLVEAERLYREALGRDPSHAGTLCYLGLLNAQQGKFDMALALLQRAVASDPRSAEAQNHLGAVLQQFRRYGEAIGRHEAALALQPTYTAARFNLASALEAAGRPADAIATLEALLAQDAGYADAHLNLGMLLRATSRPAEARTHLERAAALDPRYAARVAALLDQHEAAETAPEAAAMQRLNEFIGSFVTNQKNPRMNLYPGLSVRTSYDPQAFPLARALEAAYPEIRREVHALAAAEFHAESEGLVDNDGWDVFILHERGRRNAENLQRCPTIAGIIDNHNTVRTLAGLMYVSKLRPGTHIKAHRGPTNVRVRCHLGIDIPDGDCAIRVGDQVLRWQEGRCIMFDDHLEHEAWNRTEQPRIVLILDNWHPDLTPHEVSLIEGLHRFADYQAMSLNRYWTANAQARAKARKGYD